MGKIYTKTGDGGETGLIGGIRVEKDDIRIEANGEIDELTCVIGIVKTVAKDKETDLFMLEIIQDTLATVMTCVAYGKDLSPERRTELSELVAKMETEIDKSTSDSAFSFVLPGANQQSAYLHLARTKARTAERRLWTVNRKYHIDEDIMKFMNRLSDYLFALACRVLK